MQGAAVQAQVMCINLIAGVVVRIRDRKRKKRESDQYEARHGGQ